MTHLLKTFAACMVQKKSLHTCMDLVGYWLASLMGIRKGFLLLKVLLENSCLTHRGRATSHDLKVISTEVSAPV